MKINTKDAKRLLKPEYEVIPVYYCKHCLSLNIRTIEDLGEDYCENCSSTDIECCSMLEWEEKYRKKYNKQF